MFKKASKAQAKLRCAIFGPSGAGKTFSALRMARGLGSKIALIDTERSSASKYADRFEFDTCDLMDRTISGYTAAIRDASAAGYDVLIIDSLSHAWQELLEHVEKLAQSKFKGNTWSAWSEGTPLQRDFVGAILDFPGHVIATMRSKTEWTQEQSNGKSRPIRVGLAPEQGKGIEYEFDLLVEMSTDHVANVIKDRTGKFQDRLIEKPDENFGKELAAWLSEGVAVTATPPPQHKHKHNNGASERFDAALEEAKANPRENPFGYPSVEHENYVLKTGEHAGKKLCDVPKDFIMSSLANSKVETVKTMMRAELARRRSVAGEESNKEKAG